MLKSLELLEQVKMDIHFTEGKLKIIEKDLKEYQNLINELNVALNLNECQSVEKWISLMKKKLKALEIFKRFACYVEIVDNNTYKLCIDIHNHIFQMLLYSKEEFDLMKEILKC